MNHPLIALLLTLCGSAGLLHGQPYRLDRPDAVWDLPPVLREVSGLCFSPGDSFLLAVQDERGTMYALDPASGSIVREMRITGKGDFEGLTLAGEEVCLLRSDGRVFRWTWNGALPTSDTSGADLGFPVGADLEGLAWDPKANRFLVAAKDEPYLPPGGPKGWYAWHPDSGRDSMLLGIHPREFRERLNGIDDPKRRKRLQSWMDKDPAQFPLGPSGIAVHPLSGEVYLLSSRGKVLLVFGVDGRVRALHALDGERFRQPEGIAFNRRGDLFIATEGDKKEPARILVFRHP